jgi:K+-sensing histidine kinase KdpD
VGHEEMLIRALHDLLETAVKFSEAYQMVRVSSAAMPECWRVTIESKGRGIPESELPKFFDLFAVSEVSTLGGDLGLGPAVAARILSLFGAMVTVENWGQPGIMFSVLLRPSAPTAANLD